MRKYCNHPGCNFETEETTVNFCPFGHGALSVDSGSLSQKDKDSNNYASKVNVGMGGAVAGDINSVTTTNNYTMEKTIAEAHRESIRRFTQLCDEICKDGLLDEERRFRLSDLRLKLELSEADAKPIIEMVLKKNKKKSTVLPLVGQTILEQTKVFIAQNNTSGLTLQLKALRGWMNQYNVEELKQNYYQLYAILEPASYIYDLEKHPSDEYWQVFWGHIAYLKLDRLDKAQMMIAMLGQWGDYSEENQATLYAIGIMMLGSDRDLIMRSVDLLKRGGWSPDLKPVVDAMLALVDTSSKTISPTHTFYVTSLFSKFADMQKEYREELERKALEAERLEQQRIRREDDEAWIKAENANTLESLSEYLKIGRFHIDDANSKLDALRKEIEQRRKIAADEENWKTAKLENTTESYRKYLKIGVLYVDEARKRIEKLEHEAAEAEKRAKDEALWESAKQINTKESYSDYVKKGFSHVEEAKERIKHLEEEEKVRLEAEKRAKDKALWESAKQVNTKESYSNYVNQGFYHLEEAQERIKHLEEKEKVRLEAEKRAKDEALWESAKQINTKESYSDYVNQGFYHLEEAKERIKHFEDEEKAQRRSEWMKKNGKFIAVFGIIAVIIIVVVAVALGMNQTHEARREDSTKPSSVETRKADTVKVVEARREDSTKPSSVETRKSDKAKVVEARREDSTKPSSVETRKSDKAKVVKRVNVEKWLEKYDCQSSDLCWYKDWSTSPENMKTWNDADSYCRNLTDGGFSWRLPTSYEMTRLNYSSNGKKRFWISERSKYRQFPGNYEDYEKDPYIRYNFYCVYNLR